MIVPMKRITLIGLAAEREATLCALQRLGAVEIIAQGELEDNEKLRLLEQHSGKLDSALKAIKPYYKKPLLNVTAQCSEAELIQSKAEGDALCQKIEALEAQLSALRAEEEKCQALTRQLEPFNWLDTPLERLAPTKRVRYIMGLADARTLEAVYAINAELATPMGIEEHKGEKAAALVMACLDAEYDNALRKLKDAGLNEYIPPKLSGTAAQNIAAAQQRAQEYRAEADAVALELAAAAEQRQQLSMAADAYRLEAQRARGEAALKLSEYAYYLDGWARADKLDAVRAAIEGITDAYYLGARDPYDDEQPPVVTKNHKLIEPFEAITEMYALPSYRGIDAAAVMAPFYFLFFGMMLSDFGYGLLLFIGGMLFTKFTKPRGNMAKLVKVITYGGLSTMLCAPFIGTFFGVEWNDLFGTTIFPLLFDPMTDVMEMMLLSCGLGLVHMYAGIITKMYMCFRDGDWQSAIFDQLSWMLLLTGLVLLFVLSGSSVPLVLIILGGGMLLLFSGRPSKNPFKRLTKGLSALYNITGYLSDILSYVRIFALGLVSGAMGMVFNLIGDMVNSAFGGLGVPGIIIGFIVAAALLIVLHLFSLFINTLGAFAHTARLQFIEFFGKFYEADGVKFKPLSMDTANVNVADKTAQ